MGGMAAAIESGMPKRSIMEAATRRQSIIDSGEEIIVGVNKYMAKEPERVKILQIDNQIVREKQIARLEKVKAERD
eukprot:CAMPEP_0201281838 /NCGR_PEP_ID=MMETSP1317-20130820/4200_1 /ASSEMBLY_ACC=CAM_ASM_000770 /TAXON_ID=187299 /ORGANISM="Undescribed Undescribed, Strain Undescribed" /LENGTH=75 /DNA_ID=CAMNT_0047592879 /DNA_START=874 /DNA_END=1101 /DNA_ORIENTATION=-